MKFVATVAGKSEQVEVTGESGRYRVTLDGRVWEVDARLTAQGISSLLICGVSYVVDVTDRDGACHVDVGDETYVVEVEQETRYIIRTRGGGPGQGGAQTLRAPLPGKISHVGVAPGDEVRPGDTLVVIEAMKMENEFKAGAAGTIVDVRVQAGQAVNAGDVLLVIGEARP